MIIEKVLNNNVIVAIDPKSKKEIILMGCGIAFKKKVGQEIEMDKVEKTFVVDDKRMGNKIKKLINQIPDGIFELSHEIICYASKRLDKKLDKQIYISLSDHIAFALKRYKNNIRIKNDLLDEIRRIHKDEFKIALWAVDFLNNKLNVDLPEDEAGFIALHLINAGYNETTNNSLVATNIIKGILNVIRYYYSVEFDIDDLNYDRLLTHLKYFAKRVITNKQYDKSDTTLLELVSKSYPEAFDCVLKIKQYIEKNYNYQVNGDEIVYLTMHIHRVISVLKENN
ncbi:BglG family transcription antiterminator LicT [Clostridium gasigenes]|uniref:PRD domain-containing protein n=1 Tax=Clostridium gasigenes TaxID=94869 RepID=A0A1H0RXV6_9CLOT|nr:PRD domain-containing protein [Clostridium gasigenes]MBB6622644.1 PRD domain-containing protein [Clostridium gasigenes]MBB6714242.1 PRD domain-containing protein [Clostridium gasigenes]MBU3088576.1 PRD domain-containing protein [Clostridium gasigenes]MBU3103827.1 PRD domain-containing protein [Clostridium gasigenes]MBU3108221.1 PRD domain-containing protein [Clostridium gasigenes]